MAYKQGYTNVKRVLADFVTTVCFDFSERFENWQLLYPQIDNRQEAQDWIIENRRATIATTFIPDNKWVNNEVFEVSQAYLDSFTDNITFTETIRIYKSFVDEQTNPIMFRISYSRDITNINTFKLSINDILFDKSDSLGLSQLEFYIDTTTKEIVLLKSDINTLLSELTGNGSIVVSLEYETNSDVYKTIEITKKIIDANDGDTIAISYKQRIYDIDSAKLSIKQNGVITPLISTSGKRIDLLEFYIDASAQTFTFLKDNIDLDNGKVEVLINYKPYPTFEIPIQGPIYNSSTVKLSIKGSTTPFYNNEDKDDITQMEFYVDTKTRKLILIKDTIKLSETSTISFLINYQTWADDPITWFVDFSYPREVGDNYNNQSFFNWCFGNRIDEDPTSDNFMHVINEKCEPRQLTCFWHTTSDESVPIGDWLPLEYFISWDSSAISFVMCEDPTISQDKMIHSFCYIGALESVKNADFDDINQNFGSCGTFELGVREGESSIEELTALSTRANITFIKRYYDSYFNAKSVSPILKLKEVLYGSCTVPLTMEDDSKNLLQSQYQQYAVGDAWWSYIQPGDIAPAVTFGISGQPNTVMSRRNAFRNKFLPEYTLATQVIIKDLSNPNIELSLAKNHRFSRSSSNPLIDLKIPYEGKNMRMTIAKDLVAYNTTTNNNEILKVGTEIFLIYSDLDYLNYDGNDFFVYPASSTSQVEFNTQDDRYIASQDIWYYCTEVIIESPSGFEYEFIANEEIVAYDTSTLSMDIVTLDKGTTIQLISPFTRAGFNISQEYVIEFQYREPYKGINQFYFPSTWFDGTLSPGHTNFNSAFLTAQSTPIPSGITTITAEAMIPGSTFEKTEILGTSNNPNPTHTDINDPKPPINKFIHVDYVDSARGKGDARNPFTYSDGVSISNNQRKAYHKLVATPPHYITNKQTGESWVFTNTPNPVKVNDSRVKINPVDNSVTNIALYPYHKYASVFYYKKRTMDKCTIYLGPNEIDRMRFVLVDSTNKVLVDPNSPTYKNITMTRDSNNNVILTVDFYNLQNETVYLKMYKRNLYSNEYASSKTILSKAYSAFHNSSWSGAQYSNCGKSEKFAGDPAAKSYPYGYRCDHDYHYWNDYEAESEWTGHLNIFPINILLKYNYTNFDESITQLLTIPSLTYYQQSRGTTYGSNGGSAPNPGSGFATTDKYPEIPINSADYIIKGDTMNGLLFMSIKLNDVNTTFTPHLPKLAIATHQWI